MSRTEQVRLSYSVAHGNLSLFERTIQIGPSVWPVFTGVHEDYEVFILLHVFSFPSVFQYYMCSERCYVFSIEFNIFKMRPLVEPTQVHYIWDIYRYMSADRNDQTKKVNNGYRPPGNQCRFGQGRLGATKIRMLAKTKLPDNGSSLWPMEHVQGGMPDTIRGSKIPESGRAGPIYPICLFYVGPFFTPYIYIIIYIYIYMIIQLHT